MTDHDALGQAIADALGDGPPPSQRLCQRERLLAETSTPPRARPWLPWVVAVAASVAAIVGTTWALQRGDHESAPAEVAERDGAWLQAPEHGAVQIDLAEGSWVRVVEGARARVATFSTADGRISLESGRIEVEVEPAADRTWTVEAGPYEVTVVGTVFAVDWDPAHGTAEVEVIRGKVVVSGESLGADSIAVDAGHRLRADHARRTVTLEPRDTPVAVPAPDVELADDPPVEDTPAPRDQTKRPKPAPGPTWKSEAEAANYREALELAKKRGIDGLLGKLPAPDLLLLADTARLARDRGLARRIYERLRKRFPGTRQAAHAAFQLGRLSADVAGQHRTAAKYFETYLRESESGTFAREARGRLVQSLDKAGDKAAAKKAAKRYLDKHPTGPHAQLARSLLGGDP